MKLSELNTSETRMVLLPFSHDPNHVLTTMTIFLRTQHQVHFGFLQMPLAKEYQELICHQCHLGLIKAAAKCTLQEHYSFRPHNSIRVFD